jgi:hypothetical protein
MGLTDNKNYLFGLLVGLFVGLELYSLFSHNYLLTIYFGALAIFTLVHWLYS